MRIIYAIFMDDIYIDAERHQALYESGSLKVNREEQISQYRLNKFCDIEEVQDFELDIIFSLVNADLVRGKADENGRYYLAVQSNLTWEEAITLCKNLNNCGLESTNIGYMETADYINLVDNLMLISLDDTTLKSNILAYDFLELLYHTIHIPRQVRQYNGVSIQYYIDNRYNL